MGISVQELRAELLRRAGNAWLPILGVNARAPDACSEQLRISATGVTRPSACERSRSAGARWRLVSRVRFPDPICVGCAIILGREVKAMSRLARTTPLRPTDFRHDDADSIVMSAGLLDKYRELLKDPTLPIDQKLQQLLGVEQEQKSQGGSRLSSTPPKR